MTHKPLEYIDVKHKRCYFINCSTRASYGLLFSQKTSCSSHKTTNMYSDNNPKCLFENCCEKPNYTDKQDSYPLRCEEHKTQSDIILVEEKCIVCLETLFIKSDLRKCNICSKVNIETIRHEKELKIKTALEENKIKFIHDKMSDSSCHRHRPDFLIDCNTHYIVIEVDENQHQSYPDECERNRMINIYQGFGGMNTLFIRFNPDSYIDNSNKKIRGGITNSRIKRLVSLINSSQNYPPQFPMTVVKLYYNNDDGTNKLYELNIDNLFS